MIKKTRHRRYDMRAKAGTSILQPNLSPPFISTEG
ncbi:unnamed protein product [Schistosoma mattheei]|uniref:Uncharacterized protein n=1 Tax=Schistosoma mattheei TaxID=31246 RepID=A0A183Q0K7_9TREM|nr:unnamed protein product [Schistosoma mattheei]